MASPRDNARRLRETVVEQTADLGVPKKRVNLAYADRNLFMR